MFEPIFLLLNIFCLTLTFRVPILNIWYAKQYLGFFQLHCELFHYMHETLHIICYHGLFLFFKGENWAMIVFVSVLFKFLQGSCFFCSLQWCYGAIWWLLSRILDGYLKTGDVLLKRTAWMWTTVRPYQAMLLQIVWIMHYPSQRSKGMRLDIVLVVKMANLHVAIIVLSVSQPSSWCQLIYNTPLFLNQPYYFSLQGNLFPPPIWLVMIEWSYSATMINP